LRTDLQLTSNVSISDQLGNVTTSSSSSEGTTPACSSHSPSVAISHLQSAFELAARRRDYMNTFSSTSSFTLPSIIGDP